MPWRDFNGCARQKYDLKICLSGNGTRFAGKDYDIGSWVIYKVVQERGQP
jgi:hypothetical protein